MTSFSGKLTGKMVFNFDKMSREELNILDFQVKNEIWKRRLIQIRKIINNNKNPSINRFMKDKLSAIDTMVNHELNTNKRSCLIEEYIEELEILLEII